MVTAFHLAIPLVVYVVYVLRDTRKGGDLYGCLLYLYTGAWFGVPIVELAARTGWVSLGAAAVHLFAARPGERHWVFVEYGSTSFALLLLLVFSVADRRPAMGAGTRRFSLASPLNHAIAAGAWDNPQRATLASPVAGTGYSVGQIERALLSSIVDHGFDKAFEATAAEVTQRNLTFTKDGKRIEGPEATRAELRERHGYPELTPELKAKILGGNAARLYGVDPDALPCRPSAADREALRSALPAAANRTYGPTTPSAASALRRSSGWFA